MASTRRETKSITCTRSGDRVHLIKTIEEVREVGMQQIDIEIANLKLQRAQLIAQVEEIDAQIQALETAKGETDGEPATGIDTRTSARVRS